MKTAKAFVGALIAGLGSLGTALSDSHLTSTEIIVSLIATLTALSVVWAVPNKEA